MNTEDIFTDKIFSEVLWALIRRTNLALGIFAHAIGFPLSTLENWLIGDFKESYPNQTTVKKFITCCLLSDLTVFTPDQEWEEINKFWTSANALQKEWVLSLLAEKKNRKRYRLFREWVGIALERMGPLAPELAHMLDVASDTVRNWLSGEDRPSAAHLRRFLETCVEMNIFTIVEELNDIWFSRYGHRRSTEWFDALVARVSEKFEQEQKRRARNRARITQQKHLARRHRGWQRTPRGWQRNRKSSLRRSGR